MKRLVFYHGGSLKTASFRLRVYITNEYCKSNNYPCSIIKGPNEIKTITENDIVIMCKTHTIDVIKAVKKQNPHKLIYDISDNFFHAGGNDDMKYQLSQSDAVTCTCDVIKRVIQEEQKFKKPVFVIEDCVWYNNSKPSFLKNKSVLNICWYGCPANTRNGEFKKTLFGPVKKNSDKLPKIQYYFMSPPTYKPDGHEHENITYYPNWSLKKQENLVKDMDIVALPVRYKDKFIAGKGHTKLIDGLACGTMVVASPQDSYKIFSNYAFVGDSLIDNIIYCVNNKEEVLERIKLGQEFIEKNFSRDVVARKRLQYLQQL